MSRHQGSLGLQFEQSTHPALCAYSDGMGDWAIDYSAKCAMVGQVVLVIGLLLGSRKTPRDSPACRSGLGRIEMGEGKQHELAARKPRGWERYERQQHKLAGGCSLNNSAASAAA